MLIYFYDSTNEKQNVLFDILFVFIIKFLKNNKKFSYSILFSFYSPFLVNVSGKNISRWQSSDFILLAFKYFRYSFKDKYGDKIVNFKMHGEIIISLLCRVSHKYRYRLLRGDRVYCNKKISTGY